MFGSGFQKPNDMEHPPMSTPLQGDDDLALSIRQSGDVQCSGMVHGGFNPNAAFNPLSVIALPTTPSPLANANAPFQSYTYVPEFNNFQMDAGMRLGDLNDQHIATNSINAGSFATPFFNPNAVLDPTRNVSGVHYPTNNFNMRSLDSLMNHGVFSGGFQNSGVDMNLLHKADYNSSNMLNTAVSDRGNAMPMLQNAQNIGGNEIKKVFQATDSQSRTPKGFDGSFLSLGIGGNTEHRPRNQFSTKEISSQLHGTASPYFNNYPSPQLRSNFTSLPQGFSAGSGGTVMTSSVNNGRNSDFVAKTNTMYVPMSRDNGISGNQARSSVTFSNISSSHLGSGNMSNVALESSNPAFLAPKMMSEPLQSHPRIVNNMPPKSANYSYIPGTSGGPGGLTRPNHVGNLGQHSGVTQTQTVGYGRLPSSYQLIGHHQSLHGQIPSQITAANRPFPQRTGVQFVENCVTQPSIGDQFPKRLGLQHNSNTSSQAGQLLQTGTPQGSAPIQFSSNGMHSTGNGIPPAKVNAIPQAAITHGQPSVKRKAQDAAPVSQERKTHPRIKMVNPGQNLKPPIPTPSSVVPHVKWQGSDEPAKPTGHKCLLCKRDIAINPDGPVSQPAIPPAVAVLACGHVFHDHCLQIITPADQSKEPPCIPCAIGET